jgi:Zn-finger nucleic acid-binding protein
MQCPRCQVALRTRSVGGVEIEECRDCRGLWFEADELRRVKDASDRDLNWMDFDLWKHPDRFRVGENPLGCPTCSISMVAIDYGDTGVEVDTCTSCRGVWLDGGELEKIIGRLTEELTTMEASDLFRASLEEARELISGSEGFASEWRDLATVLRLLQYRLLSGNPTLGRMLAEFQAKSQF